MIINKKQPRFCGADHPITSGMGLFAQHTASGVLAPDPMRLDDSDGMLSSGTDLHLPAPAAGRAALILIAPITEMDLPVR